MKCIICDKSPNAKGSHIVPASLIQNCIGKHYSEESYKIDSSTATFDVYFGRDNLKNTNPEIKKHHHKEDGMLCQKCETRLGKLESEFSTEFLQKFRIDKFKNNFDEYMLETGFEISEPKKLSNLKIHVYIYSIILRYCRDLEIKNGVTILTESELVNIKTFVNGFLYEHESNYLESISNYNLILVFNKYSEKGSFVFALKELKSPYIFYFCEVIVQLFTNDLSEKAKHLFNNCLNNIKDQKAKLIIGPSDFFNDLILPPQEILASEFATNGTNQLSELNGKCYLENLTELNELMSLYDSDGLKNAPIRALENLIKKYSS
jgi:hypothetical protein